MNDALLFAGREQRKAGLPAEMVDQLAALGQSVGNPAYVEERLDEALTVRWLSQRTGRGAGEIQAALPSVMANYFGAEMTPSRAYDRIVETEALAARGLDYVPMDFEKPQTAEAGGEGGGEQAPKAERDPLAYPGWQTPRAMGAGFQEFALNVPQGLFSAAAGVFGDRMPELIRPIEDEETYRLADAALAAEERRNAERRLSGFDPGLDDAGKAAAVAYAGALAAINDANKERVAAWAAKEADGTLRSAATFWKELADATDERWGVDPAFAATGYGQFVKGVGSMPATSALMALGVTGLLGLGGATYAGVEGARMDYEGEAYDPASAVWSNLVNVGGQVMLERVIKLDGVLEKALENTAKVGGRVRLPDYLRSVARTAAGEGIEEVLQGQWDDLVAVAAYDEQRGAIPLFDEGVAQRRFWEFMAGAGGGAIMGATFGGALAFDQNRAAKKAGEYLTNRMGGLLNEYDARQVRRAYTDAELRAMKDGETLLKAANGDKAALNAYNRNVAAAKFVNLKGASYGGVTLGEVDGRPAVIDAQGNVAVVDVSTPEAAKAWQDRVAETVKVAAMYEDERVTREAAVSSLIDYITARHAEREQSGELKVERGATVRLVDQVGSLDEAQRIYESYVASGALPAGLDVRTLQIMGSSDTRWNDGAKRWETAIKIAAGAQPTVVIEESVEDYVKRQLKTEELTVGRIMAWRADVEGATDTLDERGAIEWVSKYGVAYATGKAQEGDIRLPVAFRAFLERFAAFVRDALDLGKKLLDMERDGQIPPEFLRLLQESTGTVAEKERGAVNEVPMASEVDTEMLADAMKQDNFPKIVKGEEGAFTVTAPDGQVLATLDTVEAAQDRAMEWYFEQEQAAGKATAKEEGGEVAADELMAVVRRRGGLLAASKEGAMAGELRAIAENMTTADRLRTFKKAGMDLDRLREALGEEGFDFETVTDMLDAMERSTRGEAQYPRGAGGQTFSLAKTEAPAYKRVVHASFSEQWENTETSIGGYKIDVVKNGEFLRLQSPLPSRTNGWDRSNNIIADFDELGRLVFERNIPPEARDAILMEGQRLSKSVGPLGNTTFLRFGRLPKGGKSKNYVSGKMEAGVSVYRANWNPAFESYELADADHAGTAIDLIAQGRKPVFVSGKVLGRGSDGEPVLGNAKVIGPAWFSGEGFRAAGAGGQTFSLAQTDTPEFRRWFGDSKVVDAQGKPLVVYHGTHVYRDEKRGIDFGNPTVFDRNFALSFFGRKPGMDNVGSWFTTDANSASKYGPAVMPVFLSIKKPFIITGDGANAPQWASTRLRSLVESEGGVEEFRNRLEGEGYDGVLLQDDMLDGLPGDVWVAMEPTQIKSATGNRGTFDPANSDITANLFYDDQARQQSPEMARSLAKIAEMDEVLKKYSTLYTNDVGRAALVRMREEGYLEAIDAGQAALRRSRKAGGGMAKLALPSDFRAGRIVPAVGRLLRQRTLDAGRRATEDNEKVVALYVAAKRAGMTTGDISDLDHALNNGHRDVADTYASKFGILRELNAVRAVFEAQMAELLELGVPPGKFFNGELDEETQAKLRDAMKQAKTLPAGQAGRAMIAILEAAGMKRNIESYWPRKVLNREALLQSLGLPGLQDEFERLVDKAIAAAQEAGRALTEEEMDAIVEKANANMQRRQFESGRRTPGSLKARAIEVITKEQMVHYYKGIDAAMKHNAAVRDYAETLRFFGKSVVFEPSAAEFQVLPINVRSSVGAWAADAVLAGDISAEQRRELENIIVERFSYRATPAFFAGLRSFSYLQNLTQLTTFLTATIADTWSGFYASGSSPYRYGKNFVKAMQGLSTISAMDVGLDPSKITQEYEAMEGLDPTFKEAMRGLFVDPRTAQGRAAWTPAQAMQRLFSWFADKVGLRYFERVTREAHLNSAVEYLIEQAKAGTLPRKLQRNMVRYFGEEKAAQVLADLRAGRVDDADVRFYAVNALADWKAVSLDQMPEAYLANPRGRVFYMYKTWIAAQFAGLYHEAGQDIASGEPKRMASGVTTLLYLASIMLAVGLPIDAVVSWVQGRPFIISDSIANRLMGAVGMGRYVASKLTRGEWMDALMEFFAPPMGGAVGDIQDDAEALWYLGEDLDASKLKTWRNLPGVGRVYNGYLGFRSEVNAEAREQAGGWVAWDDGKPTKTKEELEEMKRKRLAKEYSVD